MPTKNTEKQLKEKILNDLLAGSTQEQIEHKYSKEYSKKKVNKFLKDSEFLSPKNFRLGTLLVFALTLIAPPFSIYLRGSEYSHLFKPILITSIVFSTPFFIFSRVLNSTKDIRTLYKLSVGFLLYLTFYFIVFAAIAIEIRVWTLIVFPVILLPTFISEIIKFGRLVKIYENSYTPSKGLPKSS